MDLQSDWRRWEVSRSVEKQTQVSNSGEGTPWAGKVSSKLKRSYLEILEGDGIE